VFYAYSITTLRFTLTRLPTCVLRLLYYHLVFYVYLITTLCFTITRLPPCVLQLLDYNLVFYDYSITTLCFTITRIPPCVLRLPPCVLRLLDYHLVFYDYSITTLCFTITRLPPCVFFELSQYLCFVICWENLIMLFLTYLHCLQHYFFEHQLLFNPWLASSEQPCSESNIVISIWWLLLCFTKFG